MPNNKCNDWDHWWVKTNKNLLLPPDSEPGIYQSILSCQVLAALEIHAVDIAEDFSYSLHIARSWDKWIWAAELLKGDLAEVSLWLCFQCDLGNWYPPVTGKPQFMVDSPFKTSIYIGDVQLSTSSGFYSFRASVESTNNSRCRQGLFACPDLSLGQNDHEISWSTLEVAKQMLPGNQLEAFHTSDEWLDFSAELYLHSLTVFWAWDM